MPDTDRSEYNKSYYKKHKVAILKVRRNKYKDDVEYRQLVKGRFKKYYDTHSRSPSKEVGYTVKKVNGKQLFSIKYVAEMTGLSAGIIRWLEHEGFIPKSLYTDKRGWRFYTEQQVKLLAVLLSSVKGGAITKAQAKIILKRDWRKE